MQGSASINVLENFRKRQVQASQLKDDAAKDREAKLARQREMKARRRESEAKSRTHPAESNSSAPSTSTAQASTSIPADLYGGAPQGPLGLRQKAVVDYLQKEAALCTIAQVNAALNTRIEDDAALMRELRRNEKVGFDDVEGRIFYQPEINVKNKAAMLQKIQVCDKPVLLQTILEAYPKADQDVQALKAEGKIIGFQSFEAEINGEVLFPIDQRLVGFRVDAALVDLWHQTEVPEAEDDLIAAVQAAGLKPAPRKAVRRREKADRKKKARKQAKLRSVTNVHLMHLLDGDAPVTID
ncbi:hypothetical protein ACKKBG_A03660 [Auxenochlorella protothecoides x Auxenochlorella symbiontica]